MMQRPPYVPKLHSSQILTRVSGRTYESQTGLFFLTKSSAYPMKERDGAGNPSPFSVTFLTKTTDGLTWLSGQFFFGSGWMK